ncbi:MAG: hypothetical protein HC843_04645 [Sphingomonadales bacterium]|nr:hypothetical protein [Sphingomonadales bacterium]
MRELDISQALYVAYNMQTNEWVTWGETAQEALQLATTITPSISADIVEIIEIEHAEILLKIPNTPLYLARLRYPVIYRGDKYKNQIQPITMPSQTNQY